MSLDELKAKLDELSPGKLRFVTTMLESLSNTPRILIGQPTWLTSSSDWMEYFTTSLSVHHGFTSDPLTRTSFETVFRNTCESVGWDVSPPGPATQRFVDLHVTLPDGDVKKLSLKSTAAKNLSKNTAHISKLTEAAWIQDARTSKMRQEKTQDLFREYLESVDSIVMLRAFRETNKTPYCYQLLEIPSSILTPVLQIPVRAFGSESPALRCIVGDKTVATVALDRSDAKITVRNILLSHCIVHAEFVLKQD